MLRLAGNVIIEKLYAQVYCAQFPLVQRITMLNLSDITLKFHSSVMFIIFII